MNKSSFVLVPFLLALSLTGIAAPRDAQVAAQRAQLQSQLPAYFTNEYAYCDGYFRCGQRVFAVPTLSKPWFKDDSYYALKAKVEQANKAEKSCRDTLELGKKRINFAALSDDQSSLSALSGLIGLLKSKKLALENCAATLQPIVNDIVSADESYMKSANSDFSAAVRSARDSFQRELAAIAAYVAFEEAQLQIDVDESSRHAEQLAGEFISVSSEQGPEAARNAALLVNSEEGVQPVVNADRNDDAERNQVLRLARLQEACSRFEEQLSQVAMATAAQSEAERVQRLELETNLREQIAAQQRDILTQRRDTAALTMTQLGQRESQEQNNKMQEERLKRAEANIKRLTRLFTAAGITAAALLAYNNPETIVNAGEVLYYQVLPAASSAAVQGYNLAAPVVVNYSQALWGMLPNSTVMMQACRIGLESAANVTSALVTGV